MSLPAFAAPPPGLKLDPPKSTPFSVAELAKYDGSDSGKPIYLAVKGTVFDVTSKKDMYGPGGSYHGFAGKDGSKALGIPSTKAEDIVADYSGLDEKQRTTLDGWYDFFAKRYNIVGKVV